MTPSEATQRREVARTLRWRGDAVGRIEVRARLTYCARLMADGHGREECCERMRRKFGVHPRTTDRYQRIVRERWLADAAARDGTMLLERIEYLRQTSRMLRRRGEWGTMARYDRMLNEVLGANAPEKHDVRLAAMVQTTAAPASVDFARLTRGLTEEQVAQLLALSERVAPLPPDVVQGALPASGSAFATQVGPDAPPEP